MEVKVVIYKDKYYVWWKTNNSGLAQLIGDDCTKFSGTPNPANLKVVKTIQCKEFNHSWYFNTKKGVFSAATGNKIILPQILEMFKD